MAIKNSAEDASQRDRTRLTRVVALSISGWLMIRIAISNEKYGADSSYGFQDSLGNSEAGV
jgi:hypothetical protein